MSSKPLKFFLQNPQLELCTWTKVSAFEPEVNPSIVEEIEVVEITALRDAEKMIEVLSSTLAKIQAQTELFNFAKDPIRVHTANDYALEALEKLAEYRKRGSENG